MRKKLFKAIKATLLVLGGLFLLDAAAVFGYALKQPVVEKADAIIIMGAAINTPALYNRTLKALELYENDMAPVMVLSGGRINQRFISEAGYMQKVLDEHSTRPLNIRLDESAGNTYENIKNSKMLVPEAESVIIVSDSYHLARSALMAKSLGFKKVYYSAPKDDYYKPRELVFYYLREMAAMVSYVPKFLGGK